MEQVVPVGILGTLERLHQRLDTHFRALAEARRQLGADTPVFALEHGLDTAELDNLRETVRAAVVQGFPIRYRKWWLPFVVYAAESGYGYVGGEYWQTFADETPRWDEVGDRDWIGYQFKKFADEYGGLRPSGAFARHFSIISWPIVHAVLPVYLQRNLAQLLFEFRTALTSDLLNDPEALGVRLASRTGQYTERFRIFSENTALLGSVGSTARRGRRVAVPPAVDPAAPRGELVPRERVAALADVGPPGGQPCPCQGFPVTGEDTVNRTSASSGSCLASPANRSQVAAAARRRSMAAVRGTARPHPDWRATP
jgi:hypothetical protein